ncbi:hypothetical protein K1719_001801 [Acacia pycnantha]|nr:hypothetical protein K1719_001801 [Acacia pycnantha]
MENKNKGTKRQVKGIEQCVTPTAESQGLQQSGMENKRTKREDVRIRHRVSGPATEQKLGNELSGAFGGMHPVTDPFGATLQPCLEKVIEVLADANAHLIGVYGSNDEMKEVLVRSIR